MLCVMCDHAGISLVGGHRRALNIAGKIREPRRTDISMEEHIYSRSARARLSGVPQQCPEPQHGTFSLVVVIVGAIWFHCYSETILNSLYLKSLTITSCFAYTM